jgi:hypothetical protein
VDAQQLSGHRYIVLTGTVSRAVCAAHELCENGPLPKPYESQTVLNHIRRLLATRYSAGRQPVIAAPDIRTSVA